MKKRMETFKNILQVLILVAFSVFGLAYDAGSQTNLLTEDMEMSSMYLLSDSVHNVYFSGRITNSSSGNPVSNHPVIIDNDTLNGSFYPFHHIIYTDVNGNYFDTARLPASITYWEFIIKTYDCHHSQDAFYGEYNPPNTVSHHDFSIYASDNSTCHADFVAYPDSVSSLTIHFLDQSYGNADSLYWSFGDGSYSTDRNPSHTYLQSGEIRHVCLMISSSDNTCCDVFCQDVFVGNAAQCGGYFTYSSSNLLVNFYGHSLTGNTATYSWNFGDTLTGQGKNIQHQYAVPGAYLVILTTIDSSGCTRDTGQIITITDTAGYFQIYGQIFSNSFPIQEGAVLIFSVDTVPPYLPFAYAATIDTNGVYYFVAIPPGDYYLYAVPINNSGYLPTYWGNVLFWENAGIIHVGPPNNPYNIDLIQGTGFPSGGGSINVHVSVDGLKSTLLIENIAMLLMNSDYKTISFNKAVDQGNFPFGSLAYGTYFLKAEIAGVKSDLVMVVLSPDNPQASVYMTFTGNRIIGINEARTPVNSFRIFPNPVSDNANIAMHLSESTDITIKLLNLTGQQVFYMNKRMNAGNSVISIPVASLPAGMYTVCIISGNGLQFTSKLVR